MKRFIIALTFTCSFLILLSLSALADTTGYAAGDVMNVRQVPAMDASVLGEVYRADPLVVVATEGSWCKISFQGQTGYIHKDLVVFDRSEVPEPAPIQSSGSSSGSGSSGKSAPVSLGQQICDYSKNFIGVPYSWGANGPNSFDCSGLVKYVYAHFGISLPRTTYSQVAMGRSVSADQLQPGDLVFFRGAGHVGIYIGGGQYIHAPQTGYTVCIASLSNRKLYAARRII